MKKHISLILVIIWMIFIFYMSSFNASASSNQSGFIVTLIASITKTSNLDNLTFIIRKLAHFSEYFVLGVLLYNCLINYHKEPYLAIFITAIYAISDEIHQIFVPGRTFKIMDIIIDILGSILAVIIIKLIINLRKNHKSIQ